MDNSIQPIMMTEPKQIEIRFAQSLNFFLIRDYRDRTITVSFKGRQTIKHLMESLGVPHTEIGQVMMGGHQAGMDDIATDKSLITVESGARLPPDEPKFVLDGHLGRLTAYLRMLGFDSFYDAEYGDSQLAEIAHRDGRILLTRDRRLLMRKSINYGYCPRSMKPQAQLLEVVTRYTLVDWMQPFKRCIRCNHVLVRVDKKIIKHRLQPLTKKYFDDFKICPNCSQIYWKGSHFDKMQQTIQALVKKGI